MYPHTPRGGMPPVIRMSDIPPIASHNVINHDKSDIPGISGLCGGWGGWGGGGYGCLYIGGVRWALWVGVGLAVGVGVGGVVYLVDMLEFGGSRHSEDMTRHNPRIALDSSRGRNTAALNVWEDKMTATLKTAASAYAAAMNAESNLWAQYSEAYAAIRATRDAGESGARIAAAIKGEGYKVSASAVDDWARASSLTRSTVDYVNAMTAVFGEGVIKRAHNVIQEARKNGGGTAAVDMVTKALADLEGDEYALELVKVLKTLKGMGKPKREAQPPTGEDLEDGNEQLEGPNSSASSTPTPPADVVQNALDALRSLRAAIKLGEVEVTADTYADLHTAVAELWEVVKV